MPFSALTSQQKVRMQCTPAGGFLEGPPSRVEYFENRVERRLLE